MAKRKLEVDVVGDASRLKRALGEGAVATRKFGKDVEGVHVRARKSFAGMTASAAKMGGGVVAAYASIAGAKAAIDTTETLAKTTLTLHKNLGMNVEQASRWGAVAKARGIETKALAQSFGTVAKNADAASKGGKTQVAAFKALGLSTKQVHAGTKDFDGLLRNVADGFGNMKAGTEKTALGMKLFGRGWQTVLPLLRGGSKAMDEQLKLADKYGVTLHGKTVKSIEEMIAAQRESKMASMGLQVAIGTTLIPVLTKVTTSVSGFVAQVRSGTGAGGRFRDTVAPAFTAVGKAVKGIVGSIKDVVVGFQQGKVWATVLVGALAGIATTVVVFKTIVAVTKAWAVVQATLNALMMMNPLGAVVLVVAALSGAMIVAYTKSKTFRAVVNGAFNAVKSTVVGVFNALKGAASAVFPFIGKLAKNGLLGPIPLIIARWGTLKQIPGKVLGFFKELPGKFLKFGKNMMSGLADGIKSMAGGVIDAIKSTVTDHLPGFVKKALGIKSPSRVFHDIGVQIGQGLADGLRASGVKVDAGMSAGLLFPVDRAIAALNARKDSIQATFDAIDSKAQRSQLVLDLKNARVGAAQSAATSLNGGASGAGGGGVTAWAKSMLGKFAESTGKNMGPELDKLQATFHTKAAAWCAEFATTAVAMGGASKAVKTASVAAIRTAATAGSNGYQKGVKKTGRAGDLMMFGNRHVGVVESVHGSQVTTIEGNTSAGKVARRTHQMSEGDFARPVYGKGSGGSGKTKAKLSTSEIRGVAYAAGFRGKALDTAVAIAGAESGGKVGATNHNTNGSTDRGLFQINSVHGKASTYNVKANAAAAFKLYKAKGGFGDWATFNSGAYKSHMGDTGSGHGSAVAAAVSGKVKGGNGGSIADAMKALKAFDKEQARARKLAAIDLKVKGLEQLKAYKAAIDGIRSNMADLAKQAAATWRATQEKAINASHDAAVAAVGDSADAKELAALQGQDIAEQDKATREQLDADLADAVASGDLKAQQKAQDAIAAYKRGKREQELTDNLAAATKAADDEQATALSGLDQQEADYAASLQTQLDTLTTNLDQRKTTYAAWAKDVNGILAGYGLTAPTSADDEATIGAGAGNVQGSGYGSYNTPPGVDPKKVVFYDAQGKPVGMGAAPGAGYAYDVDASGHVTGLHKKAVGGRVEAGRSYMVGELGAEVFTPESSGRIGQASQSGGANGGGPMVVIQKATFGNALAAERMGKSLAHRLVYG